MKPSRKQLTMSEIGKLAGTSRSTVSRVLSNSPRVDPETRKRVEEIISQYNFRPNVFARGLRGGPTGQIAVLVQWMSRGVIADMIQGIDDVASKNDVHLLCSFAHSLEDYIALWRRFALGNEVDGTILIAPPLKLLAEHVEPDDVPTVLCACEATKNRRGWKNIDSVALDNFNAYNLILDHLLEQGCTTLLHIAGRSNVYDAKMRIQAFNEFISEHPEVTGETIRVLEMYECAQEAMLTYINSHHKPPDAVVCFNDDLALGVLDALREKGVNVPSEIAVTGFDDDPFSQFAGLTSPHVHGVEIGQEASRLLFARMDNDKDAVNVRNTFFQPPLQYRSSSMRKKNQTVYA